MAFIGIQELLELLKNYDILRLGDQTVFVIYPLKALSAGILLIAFQAHYTEIKLSDLSRLSDTLLSFLVGVGVFLIWINLDISFGAGGKGFDPSLLDSNLTKNLSIAMRLIGAALIVPVMEELFWRSFLIRYIIHSKFDSVPIGAFTWASFIISAVLFGLEHDLILAGVVAGIAYNLLLYRTRSIVQCILSHSITNLILGIYVILNGQWRFW